ncbi:SRPBCC domain-containing protein [Luteimicrobium subarcticum]|uniref:Uncharacterized protein YndB with AHSA1/START domain n=1 Tax=Luteimicrobium subarcticum TaxID=620910 RepID=A0A2M8WJ00_9MICO|nr:SRPBCC domain-containing protein [Luteimicrobium subarcticum]PJI90910.1 uncharacterized protein YndB with AHSA1/START domain [Luteimicrobium subarcticum]
MRHGTFDEDDGRPTLRFEVDVAADAERLWAAVSDPAELAAWFPQALSYRPRVGGRIDFADDPLLPPTSGEVLAWDPPRRFAFTWGDDEELWFEVTDGGPSGARLGLTDRLALRDEAARNAAGWEICLDALAAHLDGDGHDGLHAEGARDRWRAHFAAYTATGMPAGAPVPGDDE